MARTLKDLFTNSDKDVRRSSNTSLIRSEFTGLRVGEYIPNIPSLYGSDTIRITDQRTSTVVDMKEARGGQTDGGIIGGGIDAVSGGRLSSLTELQTFVGDKLGIPKGLTPTRVINTGRLEDDNTNERMITLAEIRNDEAGTLLGKFLASGGGGNPKQIIRQGVGEGIERAKSAIRGAVFGTGTDMDEPDVENLVDGTTIIPITTNKNRYSDLRPNILEELNKGNTTPFGRPLSILPYKIVDRRKPDRFGEKNIDYYQNNVYRETTEEMKQNTGGGRYLFSRANGDDENDYTLDSILVKVGNIRFNLATITGLSETFNPQWAESKMIGSPFSQHIYEGVSREVSFNLKMYSMNSDEHKEMWSKLERLGKLVYPLDYQSETGFITPPVTNLTIGSLFKSKFGFISSLSYTVDDTGTWELGFGATTNDQSVPKNPIGQPLFQNNRNLDTAGKDWKLPKIIDVALTFQFIESRVDVESRSLYTFDPVT